MVAIDLLYDGNSIIDDVIVADAVFVSQANAVPGTCQFKVKDPLQDKVFVIGKRLELIIDGVPEWSGYLLGAARVYAFAAQDTSSPATVTRLIQIDGADINVLFKKRIVFDPNNPTDVEGPRYGDFTDDTEVVEDLVADWLDLTGDDIDTSTMVQNVGTVNEDEPASPIQPTQDWGNTMQAVISLTGGIFYIDPERQLVLADVETPTAPFILTDNAEGELAAFLYNIGPWRPQSSFGEGARIQDSGNVWIVTDGGDTAEGVNWFYGGDVVPWTATTDFRPTVVDTPNGELQILKYLTPAGSTHLYGAFDVPDPLSGLSGTVEPTWPDDGSSVVDFGIVWTDFGVPDSWAASTVFPGNNIIESGRVWGGNGTSGSVMPDFTPVAPYYVVNDTDGTPVFTPPGPVIDNTVTWELEDTLATVSGAFAASIEGYRELTWNTDGTQMANDALIWGAGLGSSRIAFHREEDDSSIEAHGRWQVGEFRTDMFRESTVERRAESIVHGSDQSKRGGEGPFDNVLCTIFTPGIRVGMVVDIRSAILENGVQLPCRRSEITFPTQDSVRFRLQLNEVMDPPWGFVDIAPFPGFDFPDIDFGGFPDLGDPPTDCRITDTFNRPDQDPPGMSDTGHIWNDRGGSGGANVVGNRLQIEAGSDNDEFSQALVGVLPGFPIVGSFNVMETITTLTAGFDIEANENVRLHVRYDSNSGDFSIEVVDAITGDTVSDTTNIGTPVAPYEVSFALSATTFSVTWNGNTLSVDVGDATPDPIPDLYNLHDFAVYLLTGGSGQWVIDDLDISGDACQYTVALIERESGYFSFTVIRHFAGTYEKLDGPAGGGLQVSTDPVTEPRGHAEYRSFFWFNDLFGDEISADVVFGASEDIPLNVPISWAVERIAIPVDTDDPSAWWNASVLGTLFSDSNTMLNYYLNEQHTIGVFEDSIPITGPVAFCVRLTSTTIGYNDGLTGDITISYSDAPPADHSPAIAGFNGGILGPMTFQALVAVPIASPSPPPAGPSQGGDFHLQGDFATVLLGRDFIRDSIIVYVNGRYVRPTKYIQFPDDAKIEFITPFADATPVISVMFFKKIP